ncbi:E3 ubiquitin-protein ligase TRIM39-like [Eublepharis macularius]|uniref:E3 ubiquitin-protein ligase TRIM39-like n=1 Tax=Eublepharis macularius TaxID=481883 RepID=A0AA97J7T8_EUBMA|nr:E3 ubiquitin-protein ligase TRIM39-like [Eublepharis macularius]
MATSGDPAAALQEEATCSICLDYFQDPLMITDCGHNFCRTCITQYREKLDLGASCCPECRKPFSWANLQTNRRLGNVAELIQQLRLHRLSEPDGEQGVCGKHKEVLKLFCPKDGAFLCLICKESRAHKTHAALPIDEAVQDYQDQIRSHLTLLKKERDEILKKKESNEQVIKDTIRNIIHIRERKERTFPKQEAQPLLALLKNAEEEAVQMLDENASDALEHSSHLTELIGEMEGKCLQPALEFLQDIGAFLSKCEKEMAREPKAEMSVTAASVLQKILLVQSKLNVFSGDNSPHDLSKPKSAGTTLLPLQQPARSPTHLPANHRGGSLARLPIHPWPQQGGTTTGERGFPYSDLILQPLIPTPFIESLTFDVETAHPRLVVSRSGKSVRWGGDIQHALLPGPWRFDHSRCLLSSQGFTSGYHCWIVEVVKEGPWAIGVALESVQRKGSVNLIPREGIWAMAFNNSKYLVHTSPPTPLILSSSPRIIQVYLHYENGKVVFMDFHSKTVLYEFLSASFLGQKVYAFFRVGGPSAHLRLCCTGYLAGLRFL